MDCAGAVCMVCHNNVECMGGPGSKLVVLVGVGSIGLEVAVGSDSGKYLGVWAHHVSDGSSFVRVSLVTPERTLLPVYHNVHTIIDRKVLVR